MVRFFFRFYIGVSFALLISLVFIGFYFEAQYERALKEEHVRITKALNVILEYKLCDASPDEVGSIVNELSTQYTYNIELRNYEDLSLNLRKKMDENSFYININSGFISDLIEIYYIQPCINQILKFNPEADYDSFYNILIGVALVFILIALGITVLFLAWPVFMHTNSMLKSTYAIARGDFDMKVDESAPAPFNKLAYAINYVANKISEIITEQEMVISAASHELNTPLMRMNFVMDVAMKTKDPALLKDHLSQIYNDLNQLEQLVAEILDYSKFKFNVTNIKCKPMYLLPLLFRVRNDLCNLKPDIHIEIMCPNDLQLNGCEKSIQRVIGNLVRNAQKYAHSLIKVEIFKTDHKVVINVVDDGPGIPDSFKTAVLKPFFCIDSSRSRDTGGAGLGLAIVNKICLQHKAILVLQDNEYAGLTVKISFDAEVY
ncbi:MAG: signal transduction histidine kinase [Paraglaciecola sp.]|jgi:signal transduction histidine kinase